ncbi:hypothetical protein ACRXCV_00390 (plasmid) [Halobacteriovorax sp. GFR7]|uniref:hypothetical protein n=1 Tax=unclassified Halobacteriovorax TaxID=2639665 RepID=UPI003D95BA53
MAKVQPQAFIAVEQAIESTLLKTYQKKRNSFVAVIAKELDNNNYDGALEKAATSTKLNGVFWQNRKRLRLLSEGSFRFGQTRLADSRDLIADATQDEYLKKHVNLMKASIEKTETIIQERAMKAIEALAVQGKVTKAEKIREFVSFMDDSAGLAGENNIKLISSLHSSRLAQYGFTVEAQVRAITFYGINAVLDGRTSDICKHMHGKVFPVEYAYEQSIKLLATEDPDELKYLAPWATKASDLALLKSMNTSELMAAGWAIPPFHPYCRTYIDEAGQTIEVDFSETTSIITPKEVEPLIVPLGEDTAETLLLDQFGIPLSNLGLANLGKEILDDVNIQEATNLWSMIPNLSVVEVEELIKAIRSGEYDDFELMDIFGISFDSLEKVKSFL